MKGILLAGGAGTRLHPVTKVVNKHLLPIYNKPMIYYPLSLMKTCGLTDILIITNDVESFKALLGDGSKFGLTLEYAIQDEPRGIADAFLVANDCGFLSNLDDVMLALGDNIFYGNIYETLRGSKELLVGNEYAVAFTCRVSDPERYGVVDHENNRIIEKPSEYVSSDAVVGLYMYPKGVVRETRKLLPSKRNE